MNFLRSVLLIPPIGLTSALEQLQRYLLSAASLTLLEPALTLTRIWYSSLEDCVRIRQYGHIYNKVSLTSHRRLRFPGPAEPRFYPLTTATVEQTGRTEPFVDGPEQNTISKWSGNLEIQTLSVPGYSARPNSRHYFLHEP